MFYREVFSTDGSKQLAAFAAIRKHISSTVSDG